MVLSAATTRRLNRLLRSRPQLSIKILNRLLRIATPRLRAMLGEMFAYFGEDGWLYDDGIFQYTVQFLRRSSVPIRDVAAVKPLRVQIKPTDRAAELDIREDGSELTPEQQLAQGYQKQIKEGIETGGRPGETIVKLQSLVDIDLSLPEDSYDLRIHGERCWPSLGTLRIHRLTISAEAQLKWDVRGGKLWIYFRRGAPLSVDCSCARPSTQHSAPLPRHYRPPSTSLPPCGQTTCASSRAIWSCTSAWAPGSCPRCCAGGSRRARRRTPSRSI